jgi:predicted CopG family antitoxin
MVGSTQIMIRSSIYQKLKRFRDKNHFRSFTVAIEKLLDEDAELNRVYSEIPTQNQRSN